MRIKNAKFYFENLEKWKKKSCMGLCLSRPHEVHSHLSPPVKLLPPLLSSTLPEDSVGEVDGIMGILGRCSSIILVLELKFY